MRPETVSLAPGVAEIIVSAAIQGYEARYKEERLGILLGNVQSDTAVVKKAVIYRGGIRGRTLADVNPEYFTKRVRDLCRKHRATFLGTFHTHNEISGTISSSMSAADRDHLCYDPPHIVELIAAVWVSDIPPSPGERYLQISSNGYRIRISGYQMFPPNRFIKVFSDDAE